MRVAVVDDQPLFAEGLRMQIDATDDLVCVGIAGDGRAGIELVRRESPDVVLMDLRMPVLDGLAATAAMRAGDAEAPRVVVLTTMREDQAVRAAARAGAAAFLTKDARPEVLLATVRAAAAGDVTGDTDDLLRDFGSPPPGPDLDVLAALTPRERETFLLVARGLTNIQIAEASFVQASTVKTHVQQVLAKLGLRSRLQVVVFAHERGLVRS
ncbi:DNA-binding NarL/FixJ family response regulator [Clavibacter michiganensis]|uniref:response regulator n=1 Tax=Clavibacter michiganensis TaxID=28447 RepID=UPI001D99372A|nr:response regulator transcription factor [Clavibacter michiganensis]MBP2458830.1 DNA-binding NarL/FixJ family response regulator [Clavibacter michiganensis]MDQ0411402.1 DNA-binding NarL/FixJ family response regulator [Clavibacter michiganensis]